MANNLDVLFWVNLTEDPTTVHRVNAHSGETDEDLCVADSGYYLAAGRQSLCVPFNDSVTVLVAWINGAGAIKIGRYDASDNSFVQDYVLASAASDTRVCLSPGVPDGNGDILSFWVVYGSESADATKYATVKEIRLSDGAELHAFELTTTFRDSQLSAGRDWEPLNGFIAVPFDFEPFEIPLPVITPGPSWQLHRFDVIPRQEATG